MKWVQESEQNGGWWLYIDPKKALPNYQWIVAIREDEKQPTRWNMVLRTSSTIDIVFMACDLEDAMKQAEDKLLILVLEGAVDV